MEQVTGRQIKAARALLGWTQDKLSEKAKVAPKTVTTMESRVEIGGQLRKLISVRTTLEKAGVEFLLTDDHPGVRLLRMPK